MPKKKFHKILDNIEYKHCSKCDSWLTLDKFYYKNTWDGLTYMCKKCFLGSKSKDINKRATKKYYEIHKKEIYARKRLRYHSDESFRIRQSISRRISYALHSQQVSKKSSALDLVGCNLETLKKHLEIQFDENMTWENHGTYWHIDHIRPCASFDLSDVQQQKACFHYTNLQPLEAHENMSKRDKWVGNEIVSNYG